jgi:deferrochelatase/peroxidase EfeB
VPFLGDRQPGVDTPAAHFGLLAAFNLVSDDRARLARSLRDLTDEVRGLMEARPPTRRDTAYPLTETGILGPEGGTDGLAVTLSVGASLFDDRFGLAERRPRELVRMPFLANDRLDPAQSHGGLLLALSADQPDVLLHILRQLLRRGPGRPRRPLDAHIRMANPRTSETAGSRILRRGFNFPRGFDAAGRLDQGLAFVSYQKSLARGFLAVQARLKGEALEEYILPVGGGFFFVLPGAPTADAWLGQQLLD